MKYVVSKWQNFPQARSWTLNHLDIFLTLVKRIRKRRWLLPELWSTGTSIGTPRRRSVDEEYVRKGWFAPSTITNPGFDLPVGPRGRRTHVRISLTVSRKSSNANPWLIYLQSKYGVNVDSEGKQCVLTTLNAFNSCAIPHAFLVQHVWYFLVLLSKRTLQQMKSRMPNNSG